MITASLQRPTIFGRVQLRRRSGSDCPGRAGQALRSRGFVPRRRIIRPRLEEQSRHRDDEVSTIFYVDEHLHSRLCRLDAGRRPEKKPDQAWGWMS